jgi:hypothetical protein
MKRQSRPFLVEVKKRRSPTQSGSAASLDVAVQERTAPAPRDDMERHSALSYEEALRAADRVFGGRLAREAVTERPVEEDARERLFRKATAPVEKAPTPKQPRILPSLVEEVAPAIPPYHEAPARKRGRPRKVRPEAASEAMDAPVGLAEPSTPYRAPKPAKRAPAPRRQTAVAAEPDRPAKASPAPKAAPAAAATTPRVRRPAGLHAPGERWKRRLRHLR